MIKLLREIAVNYEQGYIFGKPSEQFLERNVFQINDACKELKSDLSYFKVRRYRSFYVHYQRDKLTTPDFGKHVYV